MTTPSHSDFEILGKLENSKYSIIKKIGEGSYGEIFLVQCILNGSCYAMKVIDFQLQSNARSVFDRELHFSLKFPNHPNILSIHDHYIVDDNYGVIIMEKMDVDLMDYLLGKHSLPINESRFIFQQICNAISHLHSQSVAHCDIKPENILLRIENDQIVEVKLCDFGFAIDWKREERNSSKFGTLDYHAPEFVNGSTSSMYDKMDVWSLGVTLFAAQTSLFPFVYKNDKLYQINHYPALKTAYNNDIGKPLSHSTGSIQLTQKDLNENDYSLLISLFEAIFNQDPQRRLNIFQVLSHPWLVNEEESKNISTAVNIVVHSSIDDIESSSCIPKKKKEKWHQKLKHIFHLNRTC